MSIAGEHREAVPAPAPAADTPAKRRRAAAQHVREARDRLISATGTRPAFDYELLRLFAQNRLSAALVILLLVGSVGLLCSLVPGALNAAVWTAAVLVIHGIIVVTCRHFLAENQRELNIRRWRMRFI